MQSPNSFLEKFSNEHEMPLSDKAQAKVDKKVAVDKKKEESLFKLTHKEVTPKKKAESSSSSSITTSVDDKTEKLSLQRKLKQYQIMFPQELSEFMKTAMFKKANKSIDDMHTCIAEMDLILSVGSEENIDNFILSSILETLKVVEPMSKLYRIGSEKYDITGLSDALKNNPQFLSLCKRMLLKYNTFIDVPLPIQLIFCVSIQATAVVHENRIKKSQLSTMG